MIPLAPKVIQKNPKKRRKYEDFEIQKTSQKISAKEKETSETRHVCFSVPKFLK